MEKEDNQSEKETNEIMDEIESALNDPKGIISHQKRLAFCLSLGTTELLERYLKEKNVLKPGYKINHQWFKKKKENVLKILESKVVSFANLDKLDKILDIAYKIESRRNELAYGGPSKEEILREMINDFLNVKKEVENE